MGYDQTEIDNIIFDTGSAWLAVVTTDCTSCTNATKYDPTSSPDTYDTMDAGDSNVTVNYADGTQLTGTQVFDWVCADTDSSSCATNFKWMNVNNNALGSTLNGVLGLCADTDAIDYGIVTPEPVADSYIEKLYDASIIESKIFALGLRDQNDSDGSFADIGFYDANAMNDQNELVWIDVESYYNYNQFFWGNWMTGIRLRDQVNGTMSYDASVSGAESYATTTNEVFAISDSGSSCLVLPNDLYTFVLDKLIPLLSYYEWDSTYGWGYLYYCSDISALKTIDILFGGVWLEVLVDDYIVNFGNGTCAFCFSQSGSATLAILGDSFLRNFYAIHDMEQKKMGFAPLTGVDTVKAAPVAGSTPSCQFESDCTFASIEDWWANLPDSDRKRIIYGTAAVFAICGILAAVWYFKCRKPAEEEPSPVNPVSWD